MCTWINENVQVYMLQSTVSSIYLTHTKSPKKPTRLGGLHSSKDFSLVLSFLRP